MLTFHGKSVFGGIAIGKIHVYKKRGQLVRREKIQDAEAELTVFYAALEKAEFPTILTLPLLSLMLILSAEYMAPPVEFE